MAVGFRPSAVGFQTTADDGFAIFIKLKNVMYTSVKGVYENGTVTFLEPVIGIGKSEVLVTFLEDFSTIVKSKKRVLGGLRHLGGSIPNDFNRPLDDFK